MSSVRQRLLVLLGVFLAGALVAGCGVPQHTDVRMDGPVAEIGSTGAGGDPDPPPGPDEADDERQLVDYFLSAAAADPGEAVEQVRQFIHSDERDSWQPDPEVIVVRVEDSVETPAGDQLRFDLVVRQVGVLSNGAVEPLVRQPEAVEFFVAPDPTRRSSLERGVAPERYRIVNPPQMIMLEDRALEKYFHPLPVYFWDTDQAVLVPDLRWLPTAIQPAARRAQTILEWLFAGPPPWLASLAGLRDVVDQVGNVVADGDTLVLELTAPSTDMDPHDLNAQLWWTLRSELAGGMTLTVSTDGHRRVVEPGAHPRNLVRQDPPQSFVVLDGEVRPYPANDAPQLPALAGGVNVGVHSAALTQGGRIAALVLADEGEQRLVIANPTGSVETELAQVRRMSRPLWLRELHGTGLVVADGRLYRFSRQAVTEVPVPAPLSGALTAVAAAPDGRRLALVAGGALFVASLRREGGTVSITTPQQLPTTATDVAGVAFSRADRMVIIGEQGGRFWLYELTVDGALEERLPFDLGAPPTVQNLVAYPADPADSSRRGPIMYEADGRAYTYALRPEPILAEELVGEDSELPDPRAPFFLE